MDSEDDDDDEDDDHDEDGDNVGDDYYIDAAADDDVGCDSTSSLIFTHVGDTTDL